MKEQAPSAPHEIDYWLTWAEQLPAPAGTIFDARSYNAWWAKQKQVRRMENTSQATGRVNGQFVQGGNKR